MFTIEPNLVIILSAHSPISFEDMFFESSFLDPHTTQIWVSKLLLRLIHVCLPYRMLFVQNFTPAPSMHPTYIEHEKCCMPNKQLRIKNFMEY